MDRGSVPRWWKPLRRAFAAMAVLPALAAAADAAERGSEHACDFVASETATVAAIVDGDTLRLDDGRVVRLAGIEVPKPLGAATADSLATAAAGLLSALSLGKRVDIVLAGEDRYGRLHADVRVAGGGGPLQAGLVAAGLARVRPLAGENACVGELYAAESAARRAGKGIWAGAAFAVRRADDPSLLGRSSLYEVVEGRILSVGHGDRLIFLDFGRDFRRDFTILVPPRVAQLLAAAGRPVDRLKGRRVRVRGLIEESGGPAIRLDDPVALELVDEDDGGGD